ncbi:MAG: DUF3372 domain-containing protein, partial [Bacteriovoracaceae bacterium]|nr:DUF3372 domain-containing protein [Bacteriovoracaceae bacterium]
AADFFAWIDSATRVRLMRGDGWPPEKLLIVPDSKDEPFGQKPLEVSRVEIKGTELLVDLAQPLDPAQTYLAHWGGQTTFLVPSWHGQQKLYNYQGNDLGLTVVGNKWQLKLWSPTASQVRLLIYGAAESSSSEKSSSTALALRDAASSIAASSPQLIRVLDMQREAQGVWRAVLDAEFYQDKNYYYQYEVTALGLTNKVLDPYAKTMLVFDPKSDDRVGKALLRPSSLAKVEDAERPQLANDLEFIATECHVRDWTIDPHSPVPEELKGTYRGMAQILPYFKELGVTHIQLMPLQKFYTVHERRLPYQDEHVPPEELNYNWGYDAHHYFIPQGQYAANVVDPAARVQEVRELIQQAHQYNIGIILDVVYNHLYESLALENAAPGCYLRRNDYGYISQSTGAGASLESRAPLMRKLIVDSLAYWYEDLGVDGFRFDLMGFIDQATMQAIQKKLPHAILYGEAWELTDLPFMDALTKTHLPRGVGAFNDSARDANLGSSNGVGMVQGNYAYAAALKTAITGGLRNFPAPWGHLVPDAYQRFADNVDATMNYMDIHDGFTLWDKLNLSVGGERYHRLQLAKQAFTILLTMQGRVILQGGDEFARSKPKAENAPNPHRAFTSPVAQEEYGQKYFQENSYGPPDFTNRIDWDRMREFQELHDYVKGLIGIRRMLPALRMNDAEHVRQGLKFLTSPQQLAPNYVAFSLDNTLGGPDRFARDDRFDMARPWREVVVIHNLHFAELVFPLPATRSKWELLADGQQASLRPIEHTAVSILANRITVPPHTSVILVAE